MNHNNGFCEKNQFPFWIEPIPAGSKTDPQLVEAESISDTGRAFAISYLRRRKKPLHNCSEREEWICEGSSPADPNVSEEEGEGGAPGIRAGISLQTMVQIMVRQDVPLQSVRIHGGAEIHLQSLEDPTDDYSLGYTEKISIDYHGSFWPVDIVFEILRNSMVMSTKASGTSASKGTFSYIDDSIREHPVPKLMETIHDPFSAPRLNEGHENSMDKPSCNRKRPKCSVMCGQISDIVDKNFFVSSAMNI
ncbi:hypothetical protein WISP_115468 [Willisornis vidua]|uniref:Uncharacterized protein n=1 Tax=Willisornis vidua TaxID=1566151 RepID=A0ABQ9CV68_9PASS|nr:hypothetical protein WISP_115468 [Willisornis vidua]